MLGVFGLVLAMSPATYDPTGPLKILILQWSAFLLAGVWFLGAWWTRTPMLRPRLLGPLWLGLLALYVLATPPSSFTGHCLQELARLAALATLYVTAAQVYRTPAQVRAFMLVTVLAVAISTGYGFVQRAGLDPFPLETPGDPLHLAMPGTFGNPNYAAHTLVIAILFATYLASRHWACLGFVALFFVHLYLTGARGSLVGLAAAGGLAGIAYLVSRRVKAPVKAAVTTLAAVVVLGLVGVGGAACVAMIRTGSPVPLDASLLLRYNSYYGAATMALDRPLLGFGPGTYEIENTPYWTAYEQKWFADRRMMNRRVHNDVLETAVDAGIPAAGLYLAILVCGIVYGLVMAFASEDAERRRLGYTFAATFAAFAVDGAFGFNFRVPVSAGLIMVVAGMLEGTWKPAPMARDLGGRAWSSLAWRTALAAVALIVAIYGTRIYESKALVQLGRSARHSKVLDLARECFIKAERLNPYGWLAPRELGLLELTQGKPEAAIPHFERALKRNPHYVMTLLDLANAEIDLAVRGWADQTKGEDRGAGAQVHLESAERLSSEALALCPVCHEAEDYLGRAMALRAIDLQRSSGGKPSPETREAWIRAEVHLKRALRLGATDRARLYGMIAQGRIALNDPGAAEEALLRAVQFTSMSEASETEIWALFARFAQTFKRQEVLRNAIEDHIARLKSARTATPEVLGRMYHRLARAHQALGAPPESVALAFREATRHAPTPPTLWRDYALFAKATGRLEDFTRDVSAAAEYVESGQPGGISVRIMASVWQGTETPEKAAQKLAAAVTSRIQAGQGEGLVDEYGWACDALLGEVRKLPEGTPERAQGVFYVAGIVARLGQLELASQLYGECAPRMPPAQSLVAMHERGQALERLGRVSEAISVYRQGLALAPDNLNVRLALARALRGESAAVARLEYQELLKSNLLTQDERDKIAKEMQSLETGSARQ